jgi:LysR family transcriptional activator of nhaA
LQLPEPVQLTCDEGKLDDLLVELAAHRFDIVLSDSPLSPTVNVKAYSHLLGESSVSVFGTAQMARTLRRDFPGSLDNAPFLLPLGTTALRRSLDHWFESQGIRPRVVAEFADSALLKSFARAGTGIFAAPSAIKEEVSRQYRVRPIGELPDVRERYYALSVERRMKHPAIVAISNRAHEELFA